jgi:nitrite reductase (NADH) small subunit/3-phenylpropionate/trans-cinnamate dioxygenase ferredoxin subunit
MANFVRIAGVSELRPGTAIGRAVEAASATVALIRVADQVYAIDDRCPHRGGSLSRGSVDGTVVICPSHGWRFDVTTGQCVGRPGVGPRRYSVRIEGDDVMIELPDPAPAAGPNSPCCLVRFGAMGHVGKFRVHESARVARGARVIVQSTRGLEVGEVLFEAGGESRLLVDQPDSGIVLREMTADDRVSAGILREGQKRAFESCRRLIDDRRVAVALVDVEQLFDGKTIIFYFLGDPPPELAELTNELAGRYAAQVMFRPFGDAAVGGCGDGCQRDGEHGCGTCGTDGDCGGGRCSESDTLQK